MKPLFLISKCNEFTAFFNDSLYTSVQIRFVSQHFQFFQSTSILGVMVLPSAPSLLQMRHGFGRCSCWMTCAATVLRMGLGWNHPMTDPWDDLYIYLHESHKNQLKVLVNIPYMDGMWMTGWHTYGGLKNQGVACLEQRLGSAILVVVRLSVCFLLPIKQLLLQNANFLRKLCLNARLFPSPVRKNRIQYYCWWKKSCTTWDV